MAELRPLVSRNAAMKSGADSRGDCAGVAIYDASTPPTQLVGMSSGCPWPKLDPANCRRRFQEARITGASMMRWPRIVVGRPKRSLRRNGVGRLTGRPTDLRLDSEFEDLNTGDSTAASGMRSGCASRVPMMESTDFREGHYAPFRRCLNASRRRGVLVEGEDVSAPLDSHRLGRGPRAVERVIAIMAIHRRPQYQRPHPEPTFSHSRGQGPAPKSLCTKPVNLIR